MSQFMPLTKREGLFFLDTVYPEIIELTKEEPKFNFILLNSIEMKVSMTCFAQLYGWLLRDLNRAESLLLSIKETLKDRVLNESEVVNFIKRVLEIFRSSFERNKAFFSGYGGGILRNVQSLFNKVNQCQEHFDYTDSEVTVQDKIKIECLHTSDVDTQLISAQQFFALGEVQSEDIEDLIEQVDDVVSDVSVITQLNDESLEKIYLDLGKTASILMYRIEFIEFVELGKTIEKFCQLLLELKSLSMEERALYFPLVESFILDLRKWVQHVLEDRDAIDVHYLDAALLAVIKQIELMIHSTEDDALLFEDDFLF